MIDKRSFTVLFLAQAIVGSQFPVNIILGGLAGALLAERPAYATLPISLVVVASMLTAPVASLIMGRFGRRVGFLIGTAAGTVAGLLAVRALVVQSFSTLLLASCFFGIAQAVQGFYRFAAAETASADARAKAISLVLGGGLISAMLGPEIVRQFAEATSVQYAGAYAAVAAINVIGAIVLAFLAIPRAADDVTQGHTGRPLSQILRDTRVVGAMLCAMISYAVMILVMTATPLAMVGSGFHSDHAADVVRWHVVAMFAPSFVTGFLIERFGHLAVIGTGLVLLVSCAAIALTGVDLHQFYLALITLGLGWNFGFVGATSLLASAHSREEQAKVQGLNDFLVFGLVAVASFGSGALLSELGWSAVQVAVIPAVALAALVLAWLAVARPRARG